MSGEKTESATAKKRSDERKKGHIFMSKDALTVISLVGMIFAMKLLFPSIHLELRAYIQNILYYCANQTNISEDFLKELTVLTIAMGARIIAPILAASVLLTVVPTLYQTKLLFSWDIVKPKFSKLNPIKGIKNLISLKSLVEVIKGIIKITILLIISYKYIFGKMYDFARTINMDLLNACGFVMNCLVQVVIYIAFAFAAVSLLDFFYQKWEFERGMKMSKQEVKEEYKQMEGDPKIKGKIKEMQRKIAMSRMMQSVPDADVVIKNPTHYAIALRYNHEKDRAPVVVAKGQDELALRIIAIAEANHVHVIENKPLARALYVMTDVEGEIPAEFYGTIADLLVYVYKLNGKDFS